MQDNKSAGKNNTENNGSDQVFINTDENISGLNHLNEPVAEEGEIESLKSEIESLKEKYLRQVAEFDNFRKRSAKEKMEIIQTAGKDVIISMLEVLDDCDRAEKLMVGNENNEAIVNGFQLVYNKLRSQLQVKGLKEMQSIGEEFNPDKHEAITEIPAPSDEMKGKVVDELVKGYYLNGKIIRFAKVVVGK